jgi:hypothetical protein
MSYTSQAQGGDVGELRRFRVSDRRTARAHRVKASATGPEMEVLLRVTVGVGAPDAMSWLAANSTTVLAPFETQRLPCPSNASA